MLNYTPQQDIPNRLDALYGQMFYDDSTIGTWQGIRRSQESQWTANAIYFLGRNWATSPKSCAVIDDIGLEPELPDYMKVDEGL